MKPIALVVDDHPVNRQVLHVALSAFADVLEAGDGAEAMRQIAAQPPHVIFLDLMMPVMDGFQVLEALRAQHPEILPKVVVVTAKADPETRERVLGQGACSFLTKPIVLTDVLAAFQDVIANQTVGSDGDARLGGA